MPEGTAARFSVAKEKGRGTVTLKRPSVSCLGEMTEVDL